MTRPPICGVLWQDAVSPHDWWRRVCWTVAAWCCSGYWMPWRRQQTTVACGWRFPVGELVLNDSVVRPRPHSSTP